MGEQGPVGLTHTGVVESDRLVDSLAMRTEDAVALFSALAHADRLAIYRLLLSPFHLRKMLFLRLKFVNINTSI